MVALSCKSRLRRWRNLPRRRNSRSSRKSSRMRKNNQLAVVEVVVAEVVTVEAEVEPPVVVAEVLLEAIKLAMSLREKTMTILSTVRLPNQPVTSRRRKTCRWMKTTIRPCDEAAFI